MTNQSSAFRFYDVRVVKNVACLSSLLLPEIVPLLSGIIVCFVLRVVELSEDKIAVCEKTAGLRSRNSSDLNSPYFNVLLPMQNISVLRHAL